MVLNWLRIQSFEKWMTRCWFLSRDPLVGALIVLGPVVWGWLCCKECIDAICNGTGGPVPLELEPEPVLEPVLVLVLELELVLMLLLMMESRSMIFPWTWAAGRRCSRRIGAMGWCLGWFPAIQCPVGQTWYQLVVGCIVLY